MTRARRALVMVGMLASLGALGLAAIANSAGARARLLGLARRARDEWRAAQLDRLREQAQRSTATLRCAPARTYGPAGWLGSLDDVPDTVVVSALFLWDRRPARSGREESERGGERPVDPTVQARTLAESPRAVVLTAPAGLLRRAQRAAPSARVQLAASGTHSLCVVAG